MYADSLDSKDFMCKGPEGLPDPTEDYEKSLHLVNGGLFRVREGLRYRQEADFWLVHIVGAWITKVTGEVAQFLIANEKTGRKFKLGDYPEDRKSLANLLTKRIVEKV